VINGWTKMSYIEYRTVDKKVHRVSYDVLTTDIELFDKRITKIIKINGLGDLQRLSLASNRIKDLWIDGFEDLTELRELNLSDNMIERIEGLDRMTKLRELNLSTNRISNIRGLDQMSTLHKLILNHNNIGWIEGLDQMTVLQSLELNDNLITRIEGLDRLVRLHQLDLGCNQITRIENLDRLVSLQELNLHWNQIKRIEGLDRLTGLKKLYLCNNLINQIEGLDRLTDLNQLDLSNNQIAKINGLDRNIALQSLMLNRTQISRIERLDRLTDLRDLSLADTYISIIEGLDQLTAIQNIFLTGAPIKEIPMTIMRLRNLRHLTFDHGVPINPIITRFLTKNNINSNRTIYDDGQNVHDTHINQSISNSLFSLMETKNMIYGSDEKILQEIISDTILTQTVKQQIIEYCQISEVHSKLNCTFMEALQIVWQTIQSHEQSAEIKKVLNQEMQDSICVCFTGRLSRLINSLNGFDDRVQIKISDQQEIANLIISIRQKYNKLDQQIEMTRKEMKDRGYDDETISTWIEYLE